MVRRTHVVQGSLACCPWWTLGGGALVAAVAVTLSGRPARHGASAELDDRAGRGVEVFAAEHEDEDTQSSDVDGEPDTRPVGGPPDVPRDEHREVDGDAHVAPQEARTGAAAPSALFRGGAARSEDRLTAMFTPSGPSELAGSLSAPEAR